MMCHPKRQWMTTGVLLLFETGIAITAWAWLPVVFGIVKIGNSIATILAKRWARLAGIVWASRSRGG